VVLPVIIAIILLMIGTAALIANPGLLQQIQQQEMQREMQQRR
jgi:type II secretory pathway pseudopilin PulG